MYLGDDNDVVLFNRKSAKQEGIFAADRQKKRTDGETPGYAWKQWTNMADEHNRPTHCSSSWFFFISGTACCELDRDARIHADAPGLLLHARPLFCIVSCTYCIITTAFTASHYAFIIPCAFDLDFAYFTLFSCSLAEDFSKGNMTIVTKAVYQEWIAADERIRRVIVGMQGVYFCLLIARSRPLGCCSLSFWAVEELLLVA